MLFACLGLLLTAPTVHAVPPQATPVENVAPSDYKAAVAQASDEGQRAIGAFRNPEGLETTLWAAEPNLANPVVFTMDDQGRAYVVETFRLHNGVTDIRSHMDWLDQDLASRTVEDRIEMYRQRLGKNFNTYGKHSDRIRLVTDSNNDGRADTATVFADGFSDAEYGLAAGVLPLGDDVYFTCIPHLYKLQDTTGDGHADERQILASGFGVHVGFLGHDLHGLCIGPDARLYFSIGDRGIHVVTREGKTLDYPDTGTVLRCELDGSNLEVYASGFRNPQEMAFDQYGNLFTGENNSDSGDKARWVAIVEGGDAGWRIGYQFIEKPVSRGPWNEEKLWHPKHPGQAAWIIPPIANLGDGPSGLVYHPGTGLGGRLKDRFLMADFRGSPANSGIRSFGVEPDGAGFKLVDSQQWFWQVLATDVDFGPDGAVYVSDWVNGWRQTGKGRIYRLADPADKNDPLVQEVQQLLAAGLDGRGDEELAKLLAHPDQRIRLRAELALIDKGLAGAEVFNRVAHTSDNPLARLHAIWGIAAVARLQERPELVESVVDLASSDDLHVRSQVARVIGEASLADQAPLLVKLLNDPEPRVRFFAGIALGKTGTQEHLPTVAELLKTNDNADAYLRHAGVMAIVGISERAGCRACVEELAQSDSQPVRMAATLAMRRLGGDQIAMMLGDPDEAVVLEAARAINDVPIPEAMPALAALITREKMPLPLALRVLNAQFRLGTPEAAQALAKYAVDESQPDRTRGEALRMLAQWAEPSGRDRVVGLWRPLEKRDAQVAVNALTPHIDALVATKSGWFIETVAETLGTLGIASAAEPLTDIATSDRPGRIRVAALNALASLAEKQAADAAKLLPAAQAVLLGQTDDTVRAAATRLLSKLDPTSAVAALSGELSGGDSVSARQAALATLAAMKSKPADEVLVAWAKKLAEGSAPQELELDILEAARVRQTDALKAEVARYEARLPADSPTSQYLAAMHGGDAERGRDLFFNRTEFSCLRCHKISGQGSEVGPELTSIASKRDRKYLWESVVDPNKAIAEGFSTVVLELADGRVLTGVLRGETGEALTVIDAEGKRHEVPKDDIEFRGGGLSAMPADLVAKMKLGELRDIVAYLVSLQGEKPSGE
jgi:quinoprotein glucose dehydrogenase